MTFTLSARSESAHKRAEILAEQSAAVHTIQQCRYSEGFEEAYAKALMADARKTKRFRQTTKHGHFVPPHKVPQLRLDIYDWLTKQAEPKTAREIAEELGHSQESIRNSIRKSPDGMFKTHKQPRKGLGPENTYEAID